MLQKTLQDIQKRLSSEQGDMPLHVWTQSHSEAIGDVVDTTFAIRRGKEVMLMAEVANFCGQAFTDQSVEWRGTVNDLFSMDIQEPKQRAVISASCNALGCMLGVSDKVIHCKEKEPILCADALLQFLDGNVENREEQKIALVGLQPAFLKALAQSQKQGCLRVLDLDAENVGQKRSGILIENGNCDTDAVLQWCDVALVTGSTMVNGTVNSLLEKLESYGCRYWFFGNSIAVAAALQKQPHYCQYATTGRK
jgi:hypothetical protein